MGADIGKNSSTNMANILTEYNNTSPDRIRYFGDPISVFDMSATTVTPSFKHKFNNSAHSYSGLQIADKVPIRGVEKNPLQTSPDDRNAEVITYYVNKYNIQHITRINTNKHNAQLPRRRNIQDIQYHK